MQLTMDQINQLASMGFSMNGVAAGSEATAEELAALGIQPDVGPDVSDDLSAPAVTPQSVAEDLAGAVPTASPVSDPQMTPDAVSAAVQAVPAAPVVTPEQLSATPGGSSIMDAIFGPKEGSDQFSNLNRQQRMMLAFGAIKDAGFALQGKEGSAFGTTLKAINDQIDMGRKARAAQAQRDALTSIMAPGGAASGDIQAQIEQLSRLAVAQPDLAPGIAVRIKALQDQLQAQAGDVSGSSQAATQLEDVNALINMIDEDPTLTTGIMGSLLSYIPGTSANIAEGLATTLRSNLALQALKDLKATGATMGALNATEFTALETELTQLDLSKGPQTAKRALKRIQTKYQNLIADAYRDAEGQVAAGNPIGQRTLDGLNRIFGGKPAWTENAGPVVPSDGGSDPLNIL